MANAAPYFITGGVRSGKSHFAEQVAKEWVETRHGDLHYLACGRVFDDEMAKRVRRHQHDREGSTTPWKTWEFPTDIERITEGLNQDSIVLLDCLTTLLDNELFTPEKPFEPAFLQQIFAKIIKGLEAIQQQAACLIIVSNEVIYEPLFPNPFLHTYAKILGLLHQEIAERADYAYMVEWGVPVLKKGGKHT